MLFRSICKGLWLFAEGELGCDDLPCEAMWDMKEPYAPQADFTRGLRIYAAFLAVAGLVWLVAPILAVMVLGFGSLAGAEHVYRVRRHSAERRWRVLSTTALGVMAVIFMIAAAFINSGRGR